jgi:hypothetical protein
VGSDDHRWCFVGSAHNENKRSTIGNIELVGIHPERQLTVTMYVPAAVSAHVGVKIYDSGAAARSRAFGHSSPIKQTEASTLARWL